MLFGKTYIHSKDQHREMVAIVAAGGGGGGREAGGEGTR